MACGVAILLDNCDSHCRVGIVKTNWDLCKPDEDSKSTVEILPNTKTKIQHLYCANGDYSQHVWDLFHDKICGTPCSTVAHYEQHLLSCHLQLHWWGCFCSAWFLIISSSQTSLDLSQSQLSHCSWIMINNHNCVSKPQWITPPYHIINNSQRSLPQAETYLYPHNFYPDMLFSCELITSVTHHISIYQQLYCIYTWHLTLH